MLNMNTLEEILTSSEHRDSVLEHVKHELQFDDRKKLKLFKSWLEDYGTEEDEKYFDGMTDDEILLYMELDDIVDQVADSTNPTELGDWLDIDWTGLAESYGL